LTHRIGATLRNSGQVASDALRPSIFLAGASQSTLQIYGAAQSRIRNCVLV